MIICSSSNIDLIQGISGYGTDGATDWRIENTGNGVFNILNSSNILVPNISIIDNGNVGIGTIPIKGTNKLQVQGAVATSGLITANAGINVNTGSLICVNDTLSKTYTATNTTSGTNDILTMRYDTMNGLRLRQTVVAANDVRYDLIQKTNNVDYTGPVISFYKGNVGIGTTNPVNILQVGSGGKLKLANDNNGYTLIGTSDAEGASNPRISIYGTTSAVNASSCEYSAPSTGAHIFLTTSSLTERMRIGNNGNVAIGTTDTATYKLNVSGSINATSVLVNGTAITAGASSQWSGTTTIYYNGGNVGIGTDNPQSSYKLQVQGNARVENQLVFNNGYKEGGGTDYACNKISLYGGGNTPTTSSLFGFGISGSSLEYFSGLGHTFYTGTTGGTNYGTERFRLDTNGNIGIGTTPTTTYKLNVNGSINATSVNVNGSAIAAQVQTNWNSTSGISSILNKPTIPAAQVNSDWNSASGLSSILNKPTIPANLWLPNGTNAYYNDGNVGIGTYTPQSSYKLQVQGNARVENQLAFNDEYVNAGATYACNKIALYGGHTNTPKTTSTFGFGIASELLEYYSAGGHLFYTKTAGGTNYGTGSLRIDKDNYLVTSGAIGIGGNPGYGLDVSIIGTGTSGSMTGSYFNTVASYFNQTLAFSLIAGRFSGAIWTTQYLVVSSDIRIKEEILDINDDKALNMILAIEPKTYKYIDRISRGDKKVYGFIAQQIKEIIPEAIKIEPSYIPNIYIMADYNARIITFQLQPTKIIIKLNDKIKCYDKDNKEIFVEVIEIIDELTFRIKDLEKEYTDTKIFVYGTEVDDFHTLNKDYIFTLNVCATQELYRMIEAHNIIIKTQDDRIKDLEAKVEMLLNNM